MFYASLYSFSYLILRSPSKVGMVIFALQIKEKITQNYQATEVAWSEHKSHESLAESLASAESFTDGQLESREENTLV